MPKMKSKRSAKKRFKITGKSKIKFYHAFHSHLAGSKNAKKKRKLRRPSYMKKQDAKKIIKLLDV